MANFSTHLIGGAVVSAGLALGCYGQGFTTPAETQMLFAIGTVGGLLPDIDADNSTPVRMAFTLIGLVTAFVVAFALVEHFRLLELLGIWVAVFLGMRYGLFELFARMTTHRGVWHSWIAALTAGLLGVHVAHLAAGVAPLLSWLVGGFVLLGYLTHLVLDEMASVDLLGHRVKRSFGTALKPMSLDAPLASLALLGLSAFLIWQAPDSEPLIAAANQVGVDAGELQAKAEAGMAWLAGLYPGHGR